LTLKGFSKRAYFSIYWVSNKFLVKQFVNLQIILKKQKLCIIINEYKMKRKKKITTTYIKQGGNKESKLTALPSNKLIPLHSGGRGADLQFTN